MAHSRNINIIRTVGVILLSIILIGIVTAAICGVVFAVYLNNYVSTAVDVDLDSFRLDANSKIIYYDSEGNEQILQDLHGSENRIWADYDEIPEDLINAFLAVEDSRFWNHKGVDWKRTIGATINFIVPFRSNYGGGSTITQQLIKNLTGEDDVSAKRKVQEIMRALELEKQYSKKDILEMYLNTIYFGQGAYGVKQAAQVYFNKDLSELSLEECVAIAGIVKNPTLYNLKTHPEQNAKRRKTVFLTMYENGILTEEEYLKARETEVKYTGVSDSASDPYSSYYSYFVDAIIFDVIERLEEEKGYSEVLAKQTLYSGGLTIVATIDMDIQNKMDEVFTDTENFPGVLGTDGTYPEAAMVIMDPYTGYVKALYGGRGEKSGNLVLNRATRTYRSPGSSIKPITVYSPGLEYGIITPATVIDDAPQDFEIRASGWPKNENGRYHGLTTVQNAIAWSLNPVAVNIFNKIGAQRSFDYATNNLGITSLVERRTRTNSDGTTQILSDLQASSLALGGLTDGVSVLEMTAAYSAFVNHGKYNTPVLYTVIYDANGDVLLDNTPITNTAMSEKTADYMIDLLTGVVTRSGGTGARAAIDGIEVGGKTGTTSSSVDRWFAGITPYYVGVCWFGYDKPQDITGVTTNPALNLWRRVMGSVLEDYPDVKFERTTEMVPVQICADSGMLVNEACECDLRGNRTITVYLAPEDVPKNRCTLHTMVNLDVSTNSISSGYCPDGLCVKVGLLNYQRLYPYDGVVISDQQYCMPYSSVVVDGVTLYPAKNLVYDFCPAHTEFTPEPDPEPDPEPPEDQPPDEPPTE